MATEISQPRSRQQALALVLLGAQLLAAVTACIAAYVDVESILVTGPALTVAGLALAFVVRQRGAWTPVLFGLSGPAVCAIGAFTIASFHLSKDEAYWPVLVIFTLYLLLLLPAYFFVLVHIRHWPEFEMRSAGDRWRYSLKSLLVVMTAVAIASALCASIIQSELSDYVVFAAFGSTATVLLGLVAWRFYMHRIRSLSARAVPLSWREWIEEYIVSPLLQQQAYTRCSFCGRPQDKAGPIVEGRHGAFICFDCAQRCSKHIAQASSASRRDLEKTLNEPYSL